MIVIEIKAVLGTGCTEFLRIDIICIYIYNYGEVKYIRFCNLDVTESKIVTTVKPL